MYLTAHVVDRVNVTVHVVYTVNKTLHVVDTVNVTLHVVDTVWDIPGIQTVPSSRLSRAAAWQI